MTRGARTDTPGHQAAELLDVLPDLCALSTERGSPIVVDDPGTEHGRRLVHTLGGSCLVTMTLDEYIELVNR